MFKELFKIDVDVKIAPWQIFFEGVGLSLCRPAAFLEASL